MERAIFYPNSPESVASIMAEAGDDYYLPLGVADLRSAKYLAPTMEEAVKDFYAALEGRQLLELSEQLLRAP